MLLLLRVVDPFLSVLISKDMHKFVEVFV